jgi:hypothetical protein
MARTFIAEDVSIERKGFAANQNERGTCTVFVDAGVAADAVGGHTPTTTLRQGLVLTRITASGLYAHFDSAAVDGRANEEHAVVLQYDLDLTRYGSTNDIEAGVQYSGPVSLAQLLVGSGFVTADAKNLTFVPNADLDSIG